MKEKQVFLGTYFTVESVLKLESLIRVIAWITLGAYCFEAGYTIFQNVNSSFLGGYSLDWFFLLSVILRIFQGFVLFVILQAAAKILLILLDIEDNTRRAARIK